MTPGDGAGNPTGDDVAEYHAEMQRLRVLQGGGDPDADQLKPPRVSATRAYHDALDTIRQLLTRQSSGRSYTEEISLTRNAKGETQISVSGQAHEDETLAEAADRVTEVYKTLRARFPLATGYVGAEGDVSASKGRDDGGQG